MPDSDQDVRHQSRVSGRSGEGNSVENNVNGSVRHSNVNLVYRYSFWSSYLGQFEIFNQHTTSKRATGTVHTVKH